MHADASLDPRLADLGKLLEAAGGLQSKLIVLIGLPRSGKTALLGALARAIGAKPLSVGAEVGDRLAGVAQRHRHIKAASILRELADEYCNGDVLLLDNIELLFDRSLQLDPLELLKRHARAKRVVAVWPGGLDGDQNTGRLTYAGIGHPEHQDYSLSGVVPFVIVG